MCFRYECLQASASLTVEAEDFDAVELGVQLADLREEAIYRILFECAVGEAKRVLQVIDLRCFVTDLAADAQESWRRSGHVVDEAAEKKSLVEALSGVKLTTYSGS